jgi:hypothetical protein
MQFEFIFEGVNGRPNYLKLSKANQKSTMVVAPIAAIKVMVIISTILCPALSLVARMYGTV